ncbi:PDZ domain-containing protein [Parasphingorhabdus cellanae]|uniref:PDZ domain-containing protein n=2 Tax=Parasphingorhabdus cellanae TaxID=2806553 RepID=A0ABX7TAQ7_9SPHN|nr:PDZ domain-containing protein [Parasphingorhabdus cellanae]
MSGLYSILLGILAVLLVVQLIRLIWLIVTPLGLVGDWQSREVQVLSPQSRLSLFNSFDPFFRSGSATTANVVTSLQLTLFGIRMNEGSGLGSAILAGPDGVQESYAVGDEIMSGVKLNTVLFDHVVIDRGGVRESLYLDQSIPAETVGTDNTRGEQSSRPTASVSGNKPSADMIAAAVDLSPRNAGGQVTGIVVSPRGEGELFRAAGFQDGDIIVSVNGQPVSSASDIATLKRQIVPGARLSVEVERGADTVPIAINMGAQ